MMPHGIFSIVTVILIGGPNQARPGFIPFFCEGRGPASEWKSERGKDGVVPTRKRERNLWIIIHIYWRCSVIWRVHEGSILAHQRHFEKCEQVKGRKSERKSVEWVTKDANQWCLEAMTLNVTFIFAQLLWVQVSRWRRAGQYCCPVTKCPW